MALPTFLLSLNYVQRRLLPRRRAMKRGRSRYLLGRSTTGIASASPRARYTLHAIGQCSNASGSLCYYEGIVHYNIHRFKSENELYSVFGKCCLESANIPTQIGFMNLIGFPLWQAWSQFLDELSGETDSTPIPQLRNLQFNRCYAPP